MAVKTSDRVTQEELDEAIRKHRYFSIGKQGGARAVFKFKNLSGLDFRGADLSGADFTGSNLSGCNLRRGNFSGAAFYGCNLDNANLEWANFARADLRGSSREGVRADGADLSTADLRGGQIFAAKTAPTAPPQTKTIDYSEKTEYRSAEIDLSRKEDEARRKAEADLSAKDEAYHRRADIDLSHEKETSRRNSGVDLSQGGDHSRASDFVLAGDPESVRAAEVSLAEIEHPMIARLKAHAKWIASKGASGTQLDISGEDMRGISDLARYPLVAIKARGANFSGMYLAGVQMQSAILDHCDLSGANLIGADLRGSSLKNANLGHARLEKANLGDLIFGTRKQAVDLTGAIVTGTVLKQD